MRRVAALQFGGEYEGDMRYGQETVTCRKRQFSYRAADSYLLTVGYNTHRAWWKETYRELLCVILYGAGVSTATATCAPCHWHR